MSGGTGSTTITQAVAQPAGPAGHPLSLVWRFPHAASPVLSLEQPGVGEIVLGRDPTCAVQLTGHDVSRRHAAIRRAADGGFLIVDLESRNGVRVNGKLAPVAPLVPQDVVRLGGWIGLVTTAPGESVEIAPGFWGGERLVASLAPLRQVATSDLPVILEGETGTGKERVADALHRWSGRDGPFVAVNCAALPDTLAEAELFGYRRGAFTGADRASPGFFRAADRGTLLLDEVSDLPLPLQAKLLRVLEEHEVQPLGEARPVPIDVRVVVAGQQPLMEAVRGGRFRGDLLARLDGITARLPPLRDRREDVLPLFSRLLESAGGGRAPAFEPDLAERLCVYDWPFNVRELVLLARRLVAVHGPGATLKAQNLPERMTETQVKAASPAGPNEPASRSADGHPPGEPVQLPALIAALRACGGNVARAAAVLGISRQRAYRLMEGQGVDIETIRSETDKSR
ncbi:MAG TPA: sigma 54-interacting transcriptional regulator [Polyangia bacterium]|nr:sigma 54-interacting transcriptional regulator [Polyangia bacterium]